MILALLPLLLLFASGIAAFLVPASAGARRIGGGGAVAAGLIGMVTPILVLLGGDSPSLDLAWSVPFGSLALGIDPLSALFLVPVCGLTILGAVYGQGYLSRAGGGRHREGGLWLFFNLLSAGMILALMARDGLLFLVAWEVMSLASYFLVIHRDDRPESRRAGWVYLVATHLGNAFLLLLFLILGRGAQTLRFDSFGTVVAAPAGFCFLLAVVGFGTKAGFVPFHVWLPEAHPAAPSHVSALMSGVMIKMGIYGILRTLTFLRPADPWWGWLLVGIGLGSGIIGVLFALAQRQVKRLLAYSSVENMGIVALGMGVGLIGLSADNPGIAVFGFAGGLLHLLNHTLFKSLLFLGAGSVIQATGTGEMDRLGGLGKRMPRTGAAFLAGSVAIAGLPPMNGFTGELLIFLAAFHGLAGTPASLALPLLGVIVGLALIGGLAAACFLKCYGSIFLGEGRSDGARHASETCRRMSVPPLILAAGCVAMGLAAPVALGPIGRVVVGVTGLSPLQVADSLSPAVQALWTVAIVGGGLALIVAVGLVARRRLLVRRGAETGITWDCGYAAPTTRMQYTGSSFVQPIMEVFGGLLGVRPVLKEPKGLVAGPGSLHTETPDLGTQRLWRPVFSALGAALAKLRWLQHGNLHLYVLYIAVTLLALLIWQLGPVR